MLLPAMPRGWRCKHVTFVPPLRCPAIPLVENHVTPQKDVPFVMTIDMFYKGVL